MNTLDRLFGRQPEPRQVSSRRATSDNPSGAAGEIPASDQLTDEQAVERYRYLLRTAPPAAIEQAHAEAFAQLTAEQRRLVLERLRRELPAQERTDRDDPRSLARLATRAELRRPGTLERTFGGMSLGGLIAVDFLSTVAGVVVGTAIADAIFNGGAFAQTDAGDTGAAAADYDSGDAGSGAAGDLAGADIGGDFGGGEF